MKSSQDQPSVGQAVTIARSTPEGVKPWLDGNWIDIGSLIVAMLYAAWRWRKNSTSKSQALISKTTASDLANGTSLFPMLILGLAVLSSQLLTELMSANKLILSIAGWVSCLSVLDDQ